MTELNRAIKAIRPPLSEVDPKSFYISWAYVAFNIAIGVYFLYTPTSKIRVPVVTTLLNNYFWGMTFIVLAIWLLVALLTNNWHSIRRAMVAGLFVKLFWAYALIALAIQIGFVKTLASMAMWFFIATIQAITVIHFLPRDVIRVKNNGGTHD